MIVEHNLMSIVNHLAQDSPMVLVKEIANQLLQALNGSLS
jgi:hypothetical protein